MTGWLTPNLGVGNVRCVVSTREIGNLALHSGEARAAVENRRELARRLALPKEPLWMNQVHGNGVVVVDQNTAVGPAADAACTRLAGQPLAVMTADCLPILLASVDGTWIAAVHAGWRGLANGVIGNAVERLGGRNLVAWVGPAIGPCHYEVDEAVRGEFPSDLGFVGGADSGHWMMDLAAIAEAQLRSAGVGRVMLSGLCTACDERFFSHRHRRERSRFAALVWKTGDSV